MSSLMRMVLLVALAGIVLAPDPGTRFWDVNAAELATLVFLFVATSCSLSMKWRSYNRAIAFHRGKMSARYSPARHSVNLYFVMERPLDTDLHLDFVVRVGDATARHRHEFRMNGSPYGAMVDVTIPISPTTGPALGADLCWVDLRVAAVDRWSARPKRRRETVIMKISDD